MIRLINFFKLKRKPLNFYQLLGGEEGIKELVDHFYQIMLSDPKAKNCLAVHSLVDGKIDQKSSQNLFFFLSGWLGGPNLFVKNIGAPRMRMRHSHIKISELERDEWIYCMKMALKEKPSQMNKKQKNIFLKSIAALAMRIQNQ